VSRADPLPQRGGGSLPGAFRAAAIDFYYHSVRLVAANVVWGLVLLAALALGFGGGPLVTLVVLPLLAVPYAGVMALATLIARDRDVVLSDAWSAYRTHGPLALGIGLATTLGVALLGSNVLIGAAAGGFIGWAFATLAASGILAFWIVGFPAWALLLDPDRRDRPIRERLRLAGLLFLAAPARTAALAFLLLVVLVVATILFAALITIAVAFTSLVAARYLLPLSDRLEHWLAERDAGRG
jgi:hypothetical protein